MNSLAFCEENSYQSFIDNFSTCKESIYVGERAISFVLGWSNRRCVYREHSHKQRIMCHFRQEHLTELKNAMQISDYSPERGLFSLYQAEKYLDSKEICSVTYQNGGEKDAKVNRTQINSSGVYRQPTTSTKEGVSPADTSLAEKLQQGRKGTLTPQKPLNASRQRSANPNTNSSSNSSSPSSANTTKQSGLSGQPRGYASSGIKFGK